MKTGVCNYPVPHLSRGWLIGQNGMLWWYKTINTNTLTRTKTAIDVTTDTCGRSCRTTPEKNIDCKLRKVREDDDRCSTQSLWLNTVLLYFREASPYGTFPRVFVAAAIEPSRSADMLLSATSFTLLLLALWAYNIQGFGVWRRDITTWCECQEKEWHCRLL